MGAKAEVEISRNLFIPEKNLPKTEEIINEAKKIAHTIRVGRTLFSKQNNVVSEREFKEKVCDTGLVTVYINIGMKTWNETARALEFIYKESQKRGFRLDRYNLILDRCMGLPVEMRNSAIEETGLVLRDSKEWMNVGQVVPIQPVMLDHMIGSPSSVVNTCKALEAGVNYIGNLAEFFTYKYPNYEDDISQATETLKALVIMAEKKNKGAVVETYMEDGFAASFYDCCTILGWAKFHRYIVEELIGGETTLGHGSTYTDPLLKAAMYFALEEINHKKTPFGWVHGNTNSFSIQGDIDKNAAIVTSDLLISCCMIKKKPAGAAVHPVPLTEAIRVPKVEEIVQVLALNSEVEKVSESWVDLIDWDKVEKIKTKIVEGGEIFFENLLAGLNKIGINIRDPLELLVSLRRMKAGQVEELFNAGKKNPLFPRKFEPVVPSCKFKHLVGEGNKIIKKIQENMPYLKRSKKKVLTATTDVHEYGISLVNFVLRELGMDVIEAGTSVEPDKVAKICAEKSPDAIAISTYNGMALRYAKQLLLELERRNCKIHIFMGGRLIEDKGPNKLAVNVEEDLKKIGISPCKDINGMVDKLLS
jgi:methylmalonyl-CoA mutase cobalamin-binding subunit